MFCVIVSEAPKGYERANAAIWEESLVPVEVKDQGGVCEVNTYSLYEVPSQARKLTRERAKAGVHLERARRQRRQRLKLQQVNQIHLRAPAPRQKQQCYPKKILIHLMGWANAVP